MVNKYNWANIKTYTNYDCEKIIKYMEFLHTKELHNKKDCWYFSSINKARGDNNSFILNLEGWYKSRNKYTVSERCIYLDLASNRNYADYEFKNEISVPIKNVQHLYDITKLKSNRLLIVNGRDIDLIFEKEIIENGN